MKDEILLEQFLAGGGLSYFRTLHERHAQTLTKFLARCYCNEEQAAKITEWAFRQLLDHPQRRGKHQLRPWLFSIAANEAIRKQAMLPAAA
jgi:DNA-directed RNA polymerase specialized sigma24 family protein